MENSEPVMGIITGLSGHNGDHLNRIGVADAQKHLSDWISDHIHAEQSLKQLQTLGLDGPSG